MERDNKILFPNLEAELARANLSKPAMAQIIGISSGAFYSKIGGKTDFCLMEMLAIANCLETMNGQKLTLDYLFNKNLVEV